MVAFIENSWDFFKIAKPLNNLLDKGTPFKFYFNFVRKKKDGYLDSIKGFDDDDN